MFCQSCGAKNAEDARFCNMCGTAIAEPGAPGGRLVDDERAASVGPSERPSHDADWEEPSKLTNRPLSNHRPVEASPAQSNVVRDAALARESNDASMLSVSLEAIGVRSNRRAWMYVLSIALLLMAVGAGAMYLAMQGSEKPRDGERRGSAEPEDPFVIGTPLPTGADTPEIEPPSDPAPGSRSERARVESAEVQRRPLETITRPDAPSVDDLGPVSGPPPDPDESIPSGATPSAPPPPPSPPAEPSSEDEPEEDALAPAEATPSSAPDDSDLERDVAMDLYAASVRHTIQRFHAPRARTCFDAATRNHPTLSGTVMLQVQVGGDGYVTGTEVTRNTTGNDALGRCLANRVRGWRLPPTPDGAPLTLSLPFSR